MLPRTCSGELYEVLGVPLNATTHEINRSYRRLALRCHPDRTGADTTEEFKAIEEAHRILSDPTQRRLYDAVGRQHMKLLDVDGGLGSLFSFTTLRYLMIIVILANGFLLLGAVLVGLRVDGRIETSWVLLSALFWPVGLVVIVLSFMGLVLAVRTRSLMLALRTIESLCFVAALVTAVLALEGILQPPLRAFWAWLAWYFVRVLQGLYTLIPAVYARILLQDQGVSASAREADSEESYERGSFSHRPTEWSTPAYVFHCLQFLWEVLVVLCFFVLAFRRAGPNPALSFWIVFAPLILYFGGLVLVQGVLGFRRPFGAAARSRRESEPEAGIAADSEPEETSLCVRLCSSLVSITWPASWLYMTCMWAAKMEWEYNGKISSFAIHPSFFLACLPIFVYLVIVILFVSFFLFLLSYELKDLEGPELSESSRREREPGLQSNNLHSYEGVADREVVSLSPKLCKKVVLGEID